MRNEFRREFWMKCEKIKYYTNENENKKWVNQSHYSSIDCNYIYKHVRVKLKAYQTRAKLVINHYLVGSLSVEVISFRQERSIIGQCLVETISLEAIRLQTEMVIY